MSRTELATAVVPGRYHDHGCLSVVFAENHPWSWSPKVSEVSGRQSRVSRSSARHLAGRWSRRDAPIQGEHECRSAPPLRDAPVPAQDGRWPEDHELDQPDSPDLRELAPDPGRRKPSPGEVADLGGSPHKRDITQPPEVARVRGGDPPPPRWFEEHCIADARPPGDDPRGQSDVVTLSVRTAIGDLRRNPDATDDRDRRQQRRHGPLSRSPDILARIRAVSVAVTRSSPTAASSARPGTQNRIYRRNMPE